MSSEDANTVIYAKTGCPFSFKVRLFLLESGLTDKVALKIVATGSPEEKAAIEHLGANLEKVTFPAAEFGPAEVVNDSDAIIERLAKDNELSSGSLTELSEYVTGPLSQLLGLYRENVELKAKVQA